MYHNQINNQEIHLEKNRQMEWHKLVISGIWNSHRSSPKYHTLMVSEGFRIFVKLVKLYFLLMLIWWHVTRDSMTSADWFRLFLPWSLLITADNTRSASANQVSASPLGDQWGPTPVPSLADNIIHSSHLGDSGQGHGVRKCWASWHPAPDNWHVKGYSLTHQSLCNLSLISICFPCADLIRWHVEWWDDVILTLDNIDDIRW